MNRMNKRVLIASLVAALGFYLFELGLAVSPLSIGLKGASVGLLAICAILASRTDDIRLLATVLFLGACGDLAIEFDLTAGALFFLASHLVAIWLYRRNRRQNLTGSQKGLAIALLVLVPSLAYQFPADRSQAVLVMIYALGLSAMGASAWTSRFSRYRVGLGAALFVASDLMIFARMGPLAGSPVPLLTIWPAYYLGQLLIFLGVMEGVVKDQASA